MALDSRSLLVIGAATAGWSFSFGLGSQAVSHWLNSLSISDTVIGLNHSFYYFGLAAGSIGLAVVSAFHPGLIRLVGPVWCAGLGMTFSSATLAIYPLGENEVLWYLLRFLNGYAGALSLIPLETIVSQDSAPQQRTLNFGIYGVSLTIGGAAGMALAPLLYPLGYVFTFGVAAFVAGVASILVLTTLRHQTTQARTVDEPVPLSWSRQVLSYGTAWCQGFLEGGMLAFLALFLESRGLLAETAGALVGVTTIGVIMFQVPVSWLADRVGKSAALYMCYLAVLGGLAIVPWLTESLWLALVLFGFGACAGAMYPLGLSLLGEGVSEAGLARAFAWYLAIECVGSLLGAAAMGMGRDAWGEASMFAIGLAAVVCVLALWAVVRFGEVQLRKPRKEAHVLQRQ